MYNNKTIKTMSRIVDILSKAIAEASTGVLFEDDVKKMIKELDECPVKVYRENENIKLPTYAKEGDACMDVYVSNVEYKDDGRVVYHTGLHFRLPDDYEMEIRPRSSNTKTTAIMGNAPGTLDQNYTGELMIVHRDIMFPKDNVSHYNVGDRVAQILVRHREKVVWDEVKTLEDLGQTSRGAGGFGSTGK